MYDADHLLRQTNLPEATQSEVEQTRENKPTYPLQGLLAQF